MASTKAAAICRASVLLVLLLALCHVQGKKGFGDGGQEYGYIDVREGAHMFYWLYYVEGGDVPKDKPLVIWLQGGPGASSTSYGNFMEIGPLDLNLNKRSSTWVNHVNLLFIDNPVGTGYSYTDHFSQLASNNHQIATDLVSFTKQFMMEYPQFQKLPLYVFCESYGGKMTAEFARDLYREQKAGNVLSNLKGIALGDSWISPIDSVLTWAPYLLQMGLLDRRGFDKLDEVAQRSRRALDEGRFFKAFRLWGEAEVVAMENSDNVDFYNIMTRIPNERASRIRAAAARGKYSARRASRWLQGMVDTKGYDTIMAAAGKVQRDVDIGQWQDATDAWGSLETLIMETTSVDFYNVLTRIPAPASRQRSRAPAAPRQVLFMNHVLRDTDEDLNRLMDEQVKPALGVIPATLKHQTQSQAVFDALAGDFMKPVTTVVEQLLNTTDVQVTVISGQLDLIVDTPGTVAWAERLHWKNGDFWVNQAIRQPLAVDGIVEGFVKSFGNFHFYWINRAGHMVPADNPAAAIEVLKTVTGLNTIKKED